MNKVFESTKLAGITFSNRIIRLATHEGMGDENGNPTEQLFKKYQALAKGGVGGIITLVVFITSWHAIARRCRRNICC